jgi:NADH:ubiquinone oxidoreductase subunit D
MLFNKDSNVGVLVMLKMHYHGGYTGVLLRSTGVTWDLQ